MEELNNKVTTSVPHLSIVINDNKINEGALEILKVIRPNWKSGDIEFKLLTDGITNKLVGCRPKDEDATKTVLVRVYGNKTDLLIDRKAENRNIILLGRLNLAPCLYATFENGLAYQFVPGCTLTDETVALPEIYQLVAKKMANLHKVQVPGCTQPQPFIWDKIQQFLDLVPDTFSDTVKHNKFTETVWSKSKIEEEVRFLKKKLNEIDNEVVFAHNDLLLGNVIYTEENNSVTFIDYEYAAHNYQAFDIGNHFAEFAGLEVIDYNKFPSKELQFDWLRTYLAEFQGEFSEKDVQKLYVQVTKFVLVSHIFWGIWALIQTEYSYIDFDYLGYAKVRFDEYSLKRDQFLSL